MNARKLFLMTLGILTCGKPLGASSHFEIGQSVSSSYDSRSLFSNPAALGFQTERNGSRFLYSLLYGIQDQLGDEWETALSYGYFAAGLESLSGSAGVQSVYSLGVGVPFGPSVFFGGKYRFTRSDVAQLSGVNSVDLGIQIRPSHRFGVGLLIQDLNNPQSGGAVLPTRFTAGVTFKPHEAWEFAVDIQTSSNSALSPSVAQGYLRWEPAPGLKLQLGYNTDQKIQAGLSLALGYGEVLTAVQPSAGFGRAIMGFQFSNKPYRSIFESETVTVTLDHQLGEAPVRGGLLGKDHPSLAQILDLLENISRNGNVRKVLIKLEAFPLGFAAAQDVRDALWKLRNGGKQIEVFLTNSDLKEYFIASAAQKIHMEPTAELRLFGLRTQRYFLKGTLDKIGIEGQFLARGEYKSAPEMFTRTQSSPLSRDKTLADLKTAEEEIVGVISKGRPNFSKAWPEIQKRALLSSSDAKEFGLVDDIAHYSELAPSTGGRSHETLSPNAEGISLLPRVAVIVAQGDILQQRVRALNLTGTEQLTPEKMEKHFRLAVSDPRVMAIVLRVSSPGGEVVASDQIAAMVSNARKSTPVIVSMGDVAASGGYFISAPGDRIFAQSLTLTGSVGVFLGKFNLGGLFSKIDLHKEILSHAPYPALLSEDRPWSQAEREILLRRLNQYYESFVQYVAKQRKLSLVNAEAAAKGQVWLGKDALKNGLVDEQGGYREAIAFAAESAGLSEGEYETIVIQEPKGLLDIFGDQEPLVSGPSPLSGLLGNGALRDLKWAESLRENPFLYLSDIEALE